MSTIQTVKQHIAEIAKADGNPRLTKRDFLVMMAKERSFTGLRLLSSLYHQRDLNRRAIKRNLDLFISNQLGPPGTLERFVADLKAGYHLQAARKFRNSAERFTQKSGFGKEMILIERAFDMLRGHAIFVPRLMPPRVFKPMPPARRAPAVRPAFPDDCEGIRDRRPECHPCSNPHPEYGCWGHP